MSSRACEPLENLRIDIGCAQQLADMLQRKFYSIQQGHLGLRTTAGSGHIFASQVDIWPMTPMKSVTIRWCGDLKNVYLNRDHDHLL